MFLYLPYRRLPFSLLDRDFTIATLSFKLLPFFFIVRCLTYSPSLFLLIFFRELNTLIVVILIVSCGEDAMAILLFDD